jgi:exopolysaccharide biosynthesis polyprenyl glycosylphosphotransferase
MNDRDRRPNASKHGVRAKLLTYLAVIDLLTISCGMIVIAWLYLGRPDHERLLTFLPFVLPAYYLIAFRQRAYRLNVVISASRSTRRAALSLAMAVILVISFTFMAKASDELSRGLAFLGGLTSATLLILTRFVFARHAFAALDGSPESEVVLIDGLMPPSDCNAFKVDVRVLGIEPDINDPVMLDRIGEIIHETDRVIICCHPDKRASWSLALKGAGVNVEVLAPELDAIGAISATHYYGTATALVATGPLNPVDRMTKRAFDLAMALLAVILALPLLVAIAILIKIDSAGPVLFVQKRIGRGNRMFSMYKFRSMYTDRLDHNAGKLITRGDARVTKVGKFIRKTSIDELPQLLNVIRGDMSIVGPRPHATGALAGDSLYWEVSSNYWSRHAVKPGLTGLAQVQGFRGNTETSDDLMKRLQADLTYVESWSIWRDVTLVLKTFSVLMHRNAF